MSRPLAIAIDRDLCVGSGMCVATAGATFALDRSGQAILVDPPGDAEGLVLDAAEGCPMMAIRVRDAATGEILFPR